MEIRGQLMFNREENTEGLINRLEEEINRFEEALEVERKV